MNAAQAKDISERARIESKVDLKEVYKGIKISAERGDRRHWTSRRLTPNEIKELEKNGYTVEFLSEIGNYNRISW